MYVFYQQVPATQPGTITTDNMTQTAPTIQYVVSADDLREVFREVYEQGVRDGREQVEPIRMLSYTETCKTFGISRTTLNKWINNGEIRRSKIGNRVFFRPSDIEETARRRSEILNK